MRARSGDPVTDLPEAAPRGMVTTLLWDHFGENCLKQPPQRWLEQVRDESVWCQRMAAVPGALLPRYEGVFAQAAFCRYPLRLLN